MTARPAPRCAKTGDLLAATRTIDVARAGRFACSVHLRLCEMRPRGLRFDSRPLLMTTRERMLTTSDGAVFLALSAEAVPPSYLRVHDVGTIHRLSRSSRAGSLGSRRNLDDRSRGSNRPRAKAQWKTPEPGIHSKSSMSAARKLPASAEPEPLPTLSPAALCETQLRFVWRSLRRFGVAPSSARTPRKTLAEHQREILVFVDVEQVSVRGRGDPRYQSEHRVHAAPRGFAFSAR